MKSLTFSVVDLQCAREIATGAPELFPESFHKWAAKVLRWFREFWTLLARYAKAMRSAPLAMKAIWSNLRAGISTRHMLRTLNRTPRAKARWQKRSFTERNDKGEPTGRLSPLRTRSKWELRAKRARQTAAAHDRMNSTTGY